MNLDCLEIQKLQPAESSFPLNDSKAETKTFMQFIKILEASSNMRKIEHHEKIRKSIKMKIPEIKSLEEMKRLYIRIFLQKKFQLFLKKYSLQI